MFGLRVPDGKSFALAGGNIIADGGGIVSVGGLIELGSVSQEGTLGLSLDGDSLSLRFAEALQRGDVSLTNGAGFLVAGNDGGDIAITAKNIEISEDGGLFAGIFPGLGFVDAQAGDISLNATYSITVAQNTRINNNVGNSNNTAIGNSGNIFIQTQNLTVRDGSQVSVSTFGEGNAGNLNIRAFDSVVVSGESNFPGGLFAQVDTNGRGNGGNLNIETQALSVSDGSKIQVSTFGLGDAGNLNIQASDVEVFETSQEIFFSTGIFAETSVARMENDPNIQGVGTGQAGNLFIDTERLSIRNGGQVSASTFGDGDAGELTVTARDFIEVIGKDLNLNSSSVLRADVIRSRDVVATGRGGNLTIETKSLNVSNGGRVSASTFAIGDAGNLTIRAADSIVLIGQDSGLFAEANSEAQGQGGSISVQTQSISLSDRAQVSAATAFGEGGNITLNVDDRLTLRDNSLISAEAEENANGGNINITAESLFGIEERSSIPPNETNDIDASSEFGLDGNVSIVTPDINPLQIFPMLLEFFR